MINQQHQQKYKSAIRRNLKSRPNNNSAQEIKTRRGLASFYVVTFVTLVLSVVVLSFVRVVIIDARRSSNDDLYQSAYDSALAGVEDARVALVKYQECQGKDTRECVKLRAYIDNGAEDCDSIAHALGRIDENASGEVPISEKTISSSYDKNGSVTMDQAYTCVTVSLSTPDFRGTLTTNNRVSLIPIRTRGNANDIKSVRVAWLSDSIKEKGKTYRYPDLYDTGSNGRHTYFYTINDKNTYYPPIVADLFQTDDVFTLGELNTNGSGKGVGGTDHSSLVLQPSQQGDHNMAASDVLEQNDKYNNYPESVKCDDNNGGEFNCYTTIELPATYNGRNRNNDTFMMRLESPYADTPVDFAITLLDANNNPVDFYGVQANVDSTGRANDLVRRVETRLDYFSDFPYPEFAIQLNPGTSEMDSLTKNFYVSRNCWDTDSDGNIKQCDDTGNADNYNAF